MTIGLSTHLISKVSLIKIFFGSDITINKNVLSVFLNK